MRCVRECRCATSCNLVHAACSLTWLNLSTNGIDVAAAVALARALSGHTGLKCIDLSSNRLCGLWQQVPWQRRVRQHERPAGT